MHRDITTIIGDIKSLKIQGARNVARSSIEALILAAKESRAKTPASFCKEIGKTAELISASRPTEPMMRNSLDDSCRFMAAEAKGKRSVDELRRSLAIHCNGLLKKMDQDAKKLAAYGARVIPDDSLVLTHCHSSSSTMILREAKKTGKRFSVVCFETRPRYQGRVTAAELAKSGIDVTLAVDGAMTLFMKKADIAIVGADAVTSRGDLINKIGTSTLAHIARINDVSFYSAAELFKYSPMTIFGVREKIEERDPKEVWDKPARGVRVRNPAFEATAAKYINGYITEAGVIPPQSFFALATEKLGIKIYE